MERAQVEGRGSILGGSGAAPAWEGLGVDPWGSWGCPRMGPGRREESPNRFEISSKVPPFETPRRPPPREPRGALNSGHADLGLRGGSGPKSGGDLAPRGGGLALNRAGAQLLLLFRASLVFRRENCNTQYTTQNPLSNGGLSHPQGLALSDRNIRRHRCSPNLVLV